jgi:DNA helicase-2/ATP-dependent DNA helicase PcrA
LTRFQKDLIDRLKFMDLLEWFLECKWLDDPIENEEKNTWKDIHGAILREHAPDNITLSQYLQEMDLMSKVAIREPGSIPCLTIHGAKGLEFKHVFLIGMAEGEFPSYQAVKKGPDSREMEEERRSCFVAITRVQETLCLSWAIKYNGYKKNRSPFIKEMGISLS